MRKYKLEKTNKQNVYEVANEDGSKSYIVRFSYRGKTYPNKNFTKLFGSNTPTQAFNKLQEVKVMLSNDENPFKKIVSSNLDDYFKDYLKTLTNNKNIYTTKKYYEKHIQPIIGSKDVKEIEKKHLLKILDGSLKELSDRSKKTLKVILNPILKRAIREDKRRHNPLDEIVFKKPKPKRELTSRVVDDLEPVAKKIYNAILEVDDIELKAIFLIGLTTVRRRSEILKLEWDDIQNDKVFVPENITKTSNIDEYPLPSEVIELLTKMKHTNKVIFSIKPDKVTKYFTKLIKDIDIKLVKNQKFTFHDTRNLFQSIMIMETLNPHLVDRCLSHNQDGSILNTYLSFSYKDRKKVFEDYWKIIRN